MHHIGNNENLSQCFINTKEYFNMNRNATKKLVIEETGKINTDFMVIIIFSYVVLKILNIMVHSLELQLYY